MDNITLIFVINEKCPAVTSSPNNHLFLFIYLHLLCIFQGPDRKQVAHSESEIDEFCKVTIHDSVDRI